MPSLAVGRFVAITPVYLINIYGLRLTFLPFNLNKNELAQYFESKTSSFFCKTFPAQKLNISFATKFTPLLFYLCVSAGAIFCNRKTFTSILMVYTSFY